MVRRNTKKEIFKLKLEGPDKWIVGTVSYSLGGVNYFTGNYNPRGYYFHANIETIKDGSRSFELFTGGLKALITETPRFNARVLETIYPEQKLIEDVMSKLMTSKGEHFAKSNQEVAA